MNQSPRQSTNPQRGTAPAQNPRGMFKELNATELYCPRCKQANPVREYLLLVLPEGDKYEYRCALCAEPVGTKIDKHQKPLSIIV